MKKKTVIILILCVLVATVIALSALKVIGPQDSFSGYTGFPVVNSPTPIASTDPSWEQSYPTTK